MKENAEQTSLHSEGQVTNSQELASIVSLIEKVTEELNKLN